MEACGESLIDWSAPVPPMEASQSKSPDSPLLDRPFPPRANGSQGSYIACKPEPQEVPSALSLSPPALRHGGDWQVSEMTAKTGTFRYMAPEVERASFSHVYCRICSAPEQPLRGSALPAIRN